MNRKIHVIINPASGKPEPILHYLHDVLPAAGITWDVSLSHKIGDISRHTLKHHGNNDVIAVYGGDGTVMEAAEALYKKATPLAIIPGGTANVMAKELAIPTDTQDAIQLLANSKKIKTIDMGMMNDKPFLLRINIGIAADMVIDASRDMKGTFGRVAYTVTGLKNLNNSNKITYRLTLDGKEKVIDGVSMMIANAGNIGIEGRTIVPNIKVHDGKLDVIVFTDVNLQSLLELASTSLMQNEPSTYLKRWRAKSVEVSSDSKLHIIKDDVEETVSSISAQVAEKSLNILVP